MSFIDFLGDVSPENYFDKYLKICKDLEKLPKELRKCNCCERHKQDFPKLGKGEIPKFNEKRKRTVNDCKCPCRHISRHLCKEWDSINEVEDIEESDSDEDSDDEDYEESGEEENSLDDFIVPDDGLTVKDRKKLDKVLRKMLKS